MRSILLKSGLLAFCAVTTALLAYLLMPESRYPYMAALIDKERLLINTPSPRLILLGGSSSAFGLDSERIEAALKGRFHVINTGLHGGLSLPVTLALVEVHVRPGDVAVVMPEWSVLHDLHRDTTALNEALGEHPPAWRYVSLRDGGVRPGVFLGSVQKRIRRLLGLLPQVEDPIFTRQGFSPRGDLVSTINLPNRPFPLIQLPLFDREPGPNAIRRINEFERRCRARGARPLLSFTPYPLELARQQPSPHDWKRRLQALTSIPIISEPERFLLPAGLFFDSVNHLNGRGRQIRTDLLIPDLLSALRP